MEELRVDGRILKWTFEKQAVQMWTRFILDQVRVQWQTYDIDIESAISIKSWKLTDILSGYQYYHYAQLKYVRLISNSFCLRHPFVFLFLPACGAYSSKPI